MKQFFKNLGISLVAIIVIIGFAKVALARSRLSAYKGRFALTLAPAKISPRASSNNFFMTYLSMDNKGTFLWGSTSASKTSFATLQQGLGL